MLSIRTIQLFCTVVKCLFVYKTYKIHVPISHNCFWPPSLLLDSPVSAENVIYETFLFLGGKLGGASLYCLPGGKGKYWKARRMTNGLVFTFLFLH